MKAVAENASQLKPTYEGQLKLLGNGTVQDKHTIYSTIEIGDSIVSGLVVPNVLKDYLARGLNQQGNTELYVGMNKLVVGIKLPEVQRYYLKGKKMTGLILFLGGIPLIPLLGIGLYFMYMGISVMSHASLAGEFEAHVGGIEIAS